MTTAGHANSCVSLLSFPGSARERVPARRDSALRRSHRASQREIGHRIAALVHRQVFNRQPQFFDRLAGRHPRIDEEHAAHRQAQSHPRLIRESQHCLAVVRHQDSFMLGGPFQNPFIVGLRQAFVLYANNVQLGQLDE